MAYKRYKMLQKYVNGAVQEEYKQGELIDDITYTTLESCNEGNKRPSEPIEGDIYQWVTVSGEYVCNDVNKYTKEKEQKSSDKGVTWTDTGRTRQGDLIEVISADCGYVPPTPSYETQYLTFEALEDGTFSFTNAVQYTIDNGATWTTLNANTASPTVTTGNKIMWKAEITPSWPSGVGTFSSSGRYNVEGNPMSLIYGDNFIGQTSLSGKTGVFFDLFKDNNYLISASNMKLVATTLSDSCYRAMFSYCTSLTAAPELPATTLAQYCYGFMFDGCTSLTTAPELPATTLAGYCYEHMFMNCTNLTTAPELPATTLAKRCYDSMFMECTSLTKAVLPATNFTNISDTPASNGYEYMQMFANCTSLVYLKAMFVDYGYLNVYNWMINIKTKGTFVKNPNATWTDAPALPATWTVVTE